MLTPNELILRAIPEGQQQQQPNTTTTNNNENQHQPTNSNSETRNDHHDESPLFLETTTVTTKTTTKKSTKSKKGKKVVIQYDKHGNIIGEKRVKIDEFGNPIKKKKKKAKRQEVSGIRQSPGEETVDMKDSKSSVGIMSAAKDSRVDLLSRSSSWKEPTRLHQMRYAGSTIPYGVPPEQAHQHDFADFEESLAESKPSSSTVEHNSRSTMMQTIGSHENKQESQSVLPLECTPLKPFAQAPPSSASSSQQSMTEMHEFVVQYMISAGVEPDVAEAMATLFEEQQQLGIDTYASQNDGTRSHDIDKFAMFKDYDDDDEDDESIASAFVRALAQGTARARLEQNERGLAASMPPSAGSWDSPVRPSPHVAGSYSLSIASLSSDERSHNRKAADMRTLLIQYLISVGTDPAAAEQMTDQFEEQQLKGGASSAPQRHATITSSIGNGSIISEEQQEELQFFQHKHREAMNGGYQRQHSAPSNANDDLLRHGPMTQSMPGSIRHPRFSRADRPGAVEMEGRAFGAPRRPEGEPGLSYEQELESNGESSSNPYLIEATPVKENEVGDDIIYAETATFGLKYILSEPKFRCMLIFIFLVVVSVTVGVTVVALKGSDAINAPQPSVIVSSTTSPTRSPSSAPTRIAADIEQAAGAISGFESVLTADSPQRRAVSWLSTLDEFDTQGLGLIFSERYLLIVFYYATNGADWLEQERWLTPTLHICDWSFAIICGTDATRRQIVTGIDFTRNGLSGNIPGEISLLDGLNLLRLGKNNINGTIPGEFAQMTSLTLLDLSTNKLSGSIPSQIGYLQNLLSLELYDNVLTGTIPSSIFDLRLMATLDLSKNNITGLLSPNISKLESLGTLNLQNNSFIGGVPSFASLTKLDFIYLDYNQFSGSFADFFDAAFVGRQEITLSHNNISGSIPELESLNISAFANVAFKIQRIDISYNQMTGTIPSTLSLLPSLRYVDVSGNSFGGPVPAQESGSSGFGLLGHIGIAGNNFIGHIPLGLTDALTSLDLSGNNLTGGIPLEFYSKFSNLEFLALSDNPIGGNISGLLGNLGALRDLQLSNCNLTGTLPDNVLGLTSLENMALNNNRINGFIPSSFGLLPRLSNLELENNELTGPLPSQLGSLSFLNAINVSNNSLTGLLPSSLVFLTLLKEFDVSGNLFVGKVPIGICENLEITTAMVGCDLECTCCTVNASVLQCGVNGATVGTRKFLRA